MFYVFYDVDHRSLCFVMNKHDGGARQGSILKNIYEILKERISRPISIYDIGDIDEKKQTRYSCDSSVNVCAL